MSKVRARKRSSQCAAIEVLEDRRLLSATATSTAFAASVASAVYGQSVTLTAIVSAKAGTPTGSVTFKDGSTTLGVAAISTGTHKAVFSATALAVGSHSLSASYVATASYAASTSSTVKETVGKDATTTTLALSSTSVTLGQPVTLTATVAAKAPGSGAPKGTVTFSSGSTVLGTATIASGKASLSEYAWFTNTYTIVATYSGDTYYSGSASASSKLTIKSPTYAKASDGLQSATVTAGSGAGTVSGQLDEVDYTGYLTNGTKFDSSLNAGRTPFTFGLGEGSVIAGWDQGVVGMKVGETRDLVIPPSLGYGSTANGSIPANSTLIFVIHMLAIDLPRVEVFGGSNYAAQLKNGQAAATAAGTSFAATKVGVSSKASSFGIASADQSFELSLTGNPFVKISGADAGDFIVTEPTSANGFVFTITFKPAAKGTRTATISIASNDPDASVFTFNLSGVGN